MRGTRVAQATERLLDRIANGEFAEDAALSSEAALAAQLDVSRLTLRGSVSVLNTQGIVRVEHGRGTFVNATSRWSVKGPSIRATTRADGDGITPLHLLHVRRMIETGVVELFAGVRTAAQLDLMQSQIETMDAAHSTSDVQSFVDSDLAFHNVILEGCGNPFVAMFYRPIGRELETPRRQTSDVAAVRVNAQRQRRHIGEALRSGPEPRGDAVPPAPDHLRPRPPRVWWPCEVADRTIRQHRSWHDLVGRSPSQLPGGGASPRVGRRPASGGLGPGARGPR